MSRYDRTPREWFAEAARCYVESHQGCAWCGGSHRVFRNDRGGLREYYCNICNFLTSHDAKANRYVCYPGQSLNAPKPETMQQK